MDDYCEFRVIYSSSGVSIHEVNIDERGEVFSVESQPLLGAKDKKALIEKLKDALLCAEEHEAIEINEFISISRSPDTEKYNLK
jgi:hypothetical protein